MHSVAAVKTMVKSHFATLPQRDRLFIHPVFHYHHDEPRHRPSRIYMVVSCLAFGFAVVSVVFLLMERR